MGRNWGRAVKGVQTYGHGLRIYRIVCISRNKSVHIPHVSLTRLLASIPRSTLFFAQRPRFKLYVFSPGVNQPPQKLHRGRCRHGRAGSFPHGPLVGGLPARVKDRLDLPAWSPGIRSGDVDVVRLADEGLDSARP